MLVFLLLRRRRVWGVPCPRETWDRAEHATAEAVEFGGIHWEVVVLARSYCMHGHQRGVGKSDKTRTSQSECAALFGAAALDSMR